MPANHSVANVLSPNCTAWFAELLSWSRYQWFSIKFEWFCFNLRLPGCIYWARQRRICTRYSTSGPVVVWICWHCSLVPPLCYWLDSNCHPVGREEHYCTLCYYRASCCMDLLTLLYRWFIRAIFRDHDWKPLSLAPVLQRIWLNFGMIYLIYCPLIPEFLWLTDL